MVPAYAWYRDRHSRRIQILPNAHRFVVLFDFRVGCGFTRYRHMEWYLAVRFTQFTVAALRPRAYQRAWVQERTLRYIILLPNALKMAGENWRDNLKMTRYEKSVTHGLRACT